MTGGSESRLGVDGGWSGAQRIPPRHTPRWKGGILQLYAWACAALACVSLAALAVFLSGWPQGVLAVTLRSPASGRDAEALPVNMALLLAFGLQHSFMARESFKRWWTRYIPVAAERSTYVLASSLAVLALLAFWRPLEGTVWRVAGAAAWGLRALGVVGFLLAAWATAIQYPSDLLGLRQARLYARGGPMEAPPFRVAGPYRYLRHPSMLGIVLLLWAAVEMPAGRLLFAAFMTAYVCIAVPLEERGLLRLYGESYRRYQQEVPRWFPRWQRSA